MAQIGTQLLQAGFRFESLVLSDPSIAYWIYNLQKGLRQVNKWKYHPWHFTSIQSFLSTCGEKQYLKSHPNTSICITGLTLVSTPIASAALKVCPSMPYEVTFSRRDKYRCQYRWTFKCEKIMTLYPEECLLSWPRSARNSSLILPSWILHFVRHGSHSYTSFSSSFQVYVLGCKEKTKKLVALTPCDSRREQHQEWQ